MFTSFEEAFRSLLKSVLLEVAREIAVQVPRSSPVQESADKQPQRLLWRPQEAAEALGISTRSLWKLTQRGVIPCIRLNRLVRYDVAALRGWIAHPEAIPAPEALPPRQPRMKSVAVAEASMPERAATAKRPPRRKVKKPSEESPVGRPPRKAAQHQPEIARAEPRSVRGFFAARLGVAPDQLPTLTNGELMRAAGLDTATLHGWVYKHKDMPSEALEKLQALYARHLAQAPEAPHPAP